MDEGGFFNQLSSLIDIVPSYLSFTRTLNEVSLIEFIFAATVLLRAIFLLNYPKDFLVAV